MKVMLDTNIFNRLVEGRFDLTRLPPHAEIYVTHIQRDELNATPDKFREKREKLLAAFSGIIQESAPTESAALGHSRLGQSKLVGKSVPTESMVWDISSWDEGISSDESTSSLYSRILSLLKTRDPNPKKVESHIRDALIAETAAANDITLISADRALIQILQELECPCILVE